ncbi:unnamed protein product, partial [Adineta ricciae]
YFSFKTKYSFYENLREAESTLCQSIPFLSIISDGGYDEFCYNDSKTFNNRSYNVYDICHSENRCISAYRIRDGIYNCLNRNDEEEEEDNEIVLKTCSTARYHRFRCSTDETTCLYANMLGDGKYHCKNKYDESWMGIHILLSRLNCTHQFKDDCQLFRRYIELSWKLNVTNDSNRENLVTKQIPFRSYCDTFWDLASKEDENITMCRLVWICPKEQWRCSSGQCIDILWVLDGEWDCPDASDEENIFHSDSYHKETFDFKEKFQDQYARQPFDNICNLTIEYPCLPINISEYSNNMRPCIDFKLIGNGQIDCIGGYDERNVLEHCSRSGTSLGYDFKCVSSNTCISYEKICKDRCLHDEDDALWCNAYQISDKDPELVFFQCLNNSYEWNRQCDHIYDCSNGEDEYMCDRKQFQEIIYRKQKELSLKTKKHIVHLPQFPNDTNIKKIINTLNVKSSNLVSKNTIYIPYWCNRGIGMLMSNNSIVCFCPPQYHGDQCQYHTDRISVILHLNFTQSIYVTSIDRTILIKVLIIFLFENQVLNIDEFHVRPVVEMNVYKKRQMYFYYSRSPELIKHKQKRYFNRSNIINEHPYSIRIEAYQLKFNRKPKRFAVWQYSIYFDFLPVYRFVKVLHLTKPNPCKDHSCNSNQECFQLLNQKSQYICLCKSNYSGINCSDFHPICNTSYCSSNSLCKPTYRGLINDNELPYCICPMNSFGHQCRLFHISQNLCRNGGTFYQGSTPDEYNCECTSEYTGPNCNQTKQSIRLYINKVNDDQDYQGFVIQYYHIDFNSFELILVNQSVYSYLPDSLLYLHNEQNAPEIILLKRYNRFHQSEIYIISLHLNVSSIEGTTSITEQNRCLSHRSMSQLKISVFEYHYLCRNNHSLFCFYDDNYLCICDENHIRVECFSYNNARDRCFHCLSNGVCLKGEQNEFLCICPVCYAGKRCQFNFESFSFTLDQLFFHDLLSYKPIIRQITFYTLVITPCLLFLLGLFNNICCFLTFRRPKCRRNGIGMYLSYITLINQLNLSILVIRLIHLTLNISDFYSNPIFDNFICKISNYLLSSTTRIIYWLNSLIAIERVCVVLFLNKNWLKQKYIARRFIICITMCILVINAYELVFIQSEIRVNEENSTVCVLNFSLNNHLWKILHKIVTIINALLPFLINLCCTIMIIYISTKNKMNIHRKHTDNQLTNTKIIDSQEDDSVVMRNIERNENDINIDFNRSSQNINDIDLHTRRSQMKTSNRFHLLINVLIEKKELIIAPAFTLIPQIFSLPFFIASFSLQCKNIQSHHLRYVLIGSYFTTFIPQLTSFFLYIAPSSYYSKEWRTTFIGQRINICK